MTSPTAAPARFVLGVDLGQARDWTAICVAERFLGPPLRVDVGHLERPPLGTRYPAVVDRVARLAVALRTRTPAPAVQVAIDYTGVGRAVLDIFREVDLAGASLVPITIHGGSAVVPDEGGFHVPKRDLVGAVQALLQTGRLKVADALPEAATLAKEMTEFRVRIGLGGHDSYGVADDWREGAHDDLVLAVAMACWLAGREPPAARSYSYLDATDDDERREWWTR